MVTTLRSGNTGCQKMDFDNLLDKELLRAFINNTPGARDFFVEKYANLIFKSIHRTFKKYSANHLDEDVEDLFQNILESFIKDDCHRLKQYRGDNNCSVASWLRVVTISRTINFITRRKTFISLDDDSDDRQPLEEKIKNTEKSVEELLINAERGRLLQMAIEKLNPKDRQIMEFYYKDDLKPEEIAKHMNVAVNTVYSWVSRIKKRLQKILQEEGLLP